MTILVVGAAGVRLAGAKVTAVIWPPSAPEGTPALTKSLVTVFPAFDVDTVIPVHEAVTDWAPIVTPDSVTTTDAPAATLLPVATVRTMVADPGVTGVVKVSGRTVGLAVVAMKPEG